MWQSRPWSRTKLRSASMPAAASSRARSCSTASAPAPEHIAANADASEWHRRHVLPDLPAVRGAARPGVTRRSTYAAGSRAGAARSPRPTWGCPPQGEGLGVRVVEGLGMRVPGVYKVQFPQFTTLHFP